MADKKKKTTQKKEPAPAAPVKKTLREEVRDSVLSITFFAITLILILSLYVNVLGTAGGFIHSVMHGMFGYACYIVPLFSLWLGIDFTGSLCSVYIS